MSELLGGGAAPASDLIKDATIESFEKDVLEASMAGPVIVDFWAPWCGPCKQLTPVLEQATTAAGGLVKLVKIDIDKNQMLASQLRIQSVPTVYGFLQGRPIDGFQGAVPESEVKAFIGRLTDAAKSLGGAQPGAGASLEDVLTAAEAAFEAGDVASAADAFGQVAQASEAGDAVNVRALAGLARCHISLRDFDQARQVFDLIPEDKRSDAAVSSVKAALELASAEGGAGDIAVLEAQVASSPDNLNGRFDLASAYIAAGDMEKALDQLLAITERDREWNDDAARKKILTVFDALGGAHPATVRGRRRLSSILFA